MNPHPQTCAICGALLSLLPPQHPRNGKVARLPQPLRNLINHLLDDGLSYAAILEKLRNCRTPLPYPLSAMNLSNWFRGGYQDFRRERLEKLAAMPEPTPLIPQVPGNSRLIPPNPTL